MLRRFSYLGTTALDQYITIPILTTAGPFCIPGVAAGALAVAGATVAWHGADPLRSERV